MGRGLVPTYVEWGGCGHTPAPPLLLSGPCQCVRIRIGVNMSLRTTVFRSLGTAQHEPANNSIPVTLQSYIDFISLNLTVQSKNAAFFTSYQSQFFCQYSGYLAALWTLKKVIAKVIMHLTSFMRDLTSRETVPLLSLN